MRFEDFDRNEQRIITEALEWAQPEFFDPGHTAEDRAVLQNLIGEAKGKRAPAATTEKQQEAGKSDSSTEDIRRRITGFGTQGHPTVDKPTRKVIERPRLQPGEHAGFLYVECCHCGHVHAFCTKQPIRTYRCGECGERTPLIDMYPLRVTCECGAAFNYKTNMVVQQMDVTCYRCGAPVAVEFLDKTEEYRPVNNGVKRYARKGGQK